MMVTTSLYKNGDEKCKAIVRLDATGVGLLKKKDGRKWGRVRGFLDRHNVERLGAAGGRRVG